MIPRPTTTRSDSARIPSGIAAYAARSASARRSSSWPTIGAVASTTSAPFRSRRTGWDPPVAAGAWASTSRSQAATARAQRSCSSRPSALAASGRRSPTRRGCRRRGTRSSSNGLGGDTGRLSAGPRADEPGPERRVRDDLPGRPDRPQGRVQVDERGCRDERLGQPRDPPDQVAPPGRVELAEDVVEQQERGPPVVRREEVQLGELEGEDRGPLLTAGGERRHVAVVQAERKVIAVGADERRPVPALLLGRLGEAPGERFTRRLSRRRNDVALVGDRQASLVAGA